MKAHSLIKKIEYILDLGNKKKKKEGLKKVLKKLKKSEMQMQESLAKAKSDEERKRLKTQIEISKAHRKKGVKKLRKLKSGE